MKELAINKFKVRTIRYTNAVSHKYNNRRFTAAKLGDEYLLEFKIADGDPSPRALCVVEKGKVAVTQLKLTQEAAEVLLLSLAEIMDFKIIDEIPPDYDLQFCDRCYQMTNHLDGVCQKCKTKKGIPEPPCTLFK